MAWCDFAVHYDQSKDTQRDLILRILYSLFIGRIKSKKPAIAFISGDSGEGKSETALTVQKMLMECQDLNYLPYIEQMNVITPMEYPKKLEALLHDPSLKKVNIITMHEAREVVKAKLWQSFVTQVIPDINAMSRKIKPLVIIIISQFIRDITTDVRYTLNFYIKIRRPKRKNARMYINIMWKDDRDLEKPKLRKRPISGYIIDPKGRWRRYVPQYFELGRPDKEAIEIFDAMDTEAKTSIIKNKLAKLLQELRKDTLDANAKIESMVDYYSQSNDLLSVVGKQWRGKWIVKPQIKKMHDLSPDEVKTFQDRLNEKVKSMEVQNGEEDPGS